MPLPIAFTWSEDENSLNFVLQVRGVKAKNVDVALCDVYVKVNCHPSLFEADLSGEIDPEHPKTRCRVGSDKVTLTLRKREPGLWHEFRASGSKAELRERRQQALAAAEEREKARLQRREDVKQDKIKAGEHEQWRLDRENREQIEKWELEEKQKWEEDMYATFDEEGNAMEEPAQALPRRDADDLDQVDTVDSAGPVIEDLDEPDVASASSPSAAAAPATTVVKLPAKGAAPAPQDPEDDTEEYVPDVRQAPGKIGIRFTERPRAGVPVRDRGQRAPPHPKKKVTSELPPMVAGDEPEDENDPVWLKDKGDQLMVDGDYQGAYNAYTSALKLASNARCFANRSVASLYLGNLEACLEDGNNALRILDLRNRVPDGQMPGSADPQDQVVRARVHVRMGTAYLWKGAFGKAEEHYTKALETEDGLDFEARQKVKEDMERIQQAKKSLLAKEKADAAANRAQGGGDFEKEALDTALSLYDEAAATNAGSAVVHANRCYAHLRAGQLQECLASGDAAIDTLRKWPTARRAPKKPERPLRLEPPYIDDPTFKHPDQQNQGEVDWLMKHGGGSWKDLPSLPPEYEWVKDAAEKSEDAWIAIRKKMPKATIDAIRRATVKLQDVLYSRRPKLIREAIEVAIEENKAGEGPSNKAIRQSTEYADKLEEYEKEREAEREREEEELRQELEEGDLQELMAPVGSGIAQRGFPYGHPVECSRRRLFVKTLLRRARAFELLGDLEAAAGELRSALRVEPANPEARQRQKALEAARSSATEEVTEPEAAPATAPAEAPASAAVASGMQVEPPVQAAASVGAEAAQKAEGSSASRRRAARDRGIEDDEDEEEEVDHSSNEQLLAAAAQYMKKNDYEGALQIYNYTRSRRKGWPSAAAELKMMSNRSLCLQRLRGRLPELVSACDEALDRIAELRARGDSSVSEETLLQMECACLSRRGSAYMQQQQTEKGNADALRVRELLAQASKQDSGHPAPAPAG